MTEHQDKSSDVMNKHISKLDHQASTLVKTTKKQDINQRML